MATTAPQKRREPNGSHAISPFERLQSQIDRVFDDFTSGFHWPGLFSGTGDVLPSMEVHHGDKNVVVSAELPGMEEKDIDIRVDGAMLTISGEKKSETEHKEGDLVRTERSYGSFSRSVTMPFEIAPEKVSASYDKGVLTLSIEKPAAAQRAARKIEIRH